MRAVFIMLVAVLGLGVSGCGTTRGVFQGTGAVLEGAATDIRAVGDWF